MPPREHESMVRWARFLLGKGFGDNTYLHQGVQPWRTKKAEEARNRETSDRPRGNRTAMCAPAKAASSRGTWPRTPAGVSRGTREDTTRVAKATRKNRLRAIASGVSGDLAATVTHPRSGTWCWFSG